MSGRTTFSQLVDAVHLLALAAWMSAIVASGVAATAVFTMLPRASIVVPAFESSVAITAATPEERAREHGRIAGGMVMDPVFRWSDRVQAGLAALAVGTLLLQAMQHGGRWRLAGRPLNLMRLACILGASILLAAQLAILGPRMESALHAWWTAAQAGDPGADALRTSFDLDHVVANRLYTLRLLLVAAAIALFAMASGQPASRPSTPST